MTVFLAGTASGQTPGSPWTLEQCIRYAQEHNITLKQGDLQVRQQEIQLETAKGSRLPQVSGSASESMSFGRGLTADNTYSNTNTTSTGFSLGASVPVFQGFKIGNSIKEGELNLKAATADLEKAKEDISVAVAQAYVQILYNMEILDVSMRQVAIDSLQTERLGAMLENGKASQAQVSQQKAALGQSRLAATQARNNLNLSLLDLSQLLELPSPEGFSIVRPDVPVDGILLGNPEDIYAQALEIKPSIQAEKFRLDATEFSIKGAKGSFLPSISASGGVGTNYYTMSSAPSDVFFDQIKGAEMMAYFDSTGGLQRFDSMGGASGVFFLEENGALATVNKFAAKMLTATFRDGNLYDLSYFEEVKSDAYPVVQLKKDERVLKGFDWQPEKRPTGPEDVTSYVPRESEREKYLKISQPVFQYTDEYFPGYLEQLDKDLKAAREKKRERQAEQKRLEEERKALEAMQASLEDSGEENDGEPAEGAQADTLAVPAPLDSLKAASPSERADTIELNAEQIDSLLSGKSIEALKAAIPADPKAELKAKQKAEREAKQAEREKIRQERASRKEAKWAALDAKDAEKAAKKEAKRQEKQRIKMEKMLKARAKREAKEQKILEGYKAKFEKQKARKEEKSLK